MGDDNPPNSAPAPAPPDSARPPAHAAKPPAPQTPLPHSRPRTSPRLATARGWAVHHSGLCRANLLPLFHEVEERAGERRLCLPLIPLRVVRVFRGESLPCIPRIPWFQFPSA